VRMIEPPFPAAEKAPVPTALVAETRAKTCDPHGRLYGAAFKVEN
jgi:hypothetical protein